MKIRILKILLFVLTSSLPGLSQISIDLPINMSVFQRNSSNNATVYIAGTYQNPIVTSIQARLLNPGTTTPISGFDWQIIQSNPTKGKYYGQLNAVPAGWYTLEVKLVNTNVTLSTTSVAKLGVGDVYLISGQSNAAGIDPLDASAYVDPPVMNNERSLSHNSVQGCFATYPDFAQLSAINTGHKISVSGESPWAYSVLGNNLVNNLNVPVAFFNGAAGGTSIENWLASSNGLPTNGVHQPYNGSQYCNSVGAPYNIFTKALKYYPNLYGVRAIIWHQGETDQAINTSQSDYQNKLTSFITKTRTDFGAIIPWMVSRASYFEGNTSVNVINGQNAQINASNQVFAGPITDGYTSSDRTDNIHFNASGMSKFAGDLYNSITVGTFLSSSTPIPSKTVPETSISVSNGSVTLTAPGGYSSYKWVSGNNINGNAEGTSASYSNSSGTYRCYLTDGNGNVTMSQAVNISNIISQQSLSSTYVDSLYLSNYTPYSIQNGLGPVSFDQSVGSTANEGDGSIMEIKGKSFTKGIGTHSGSELIYKMKTGLHARFKASVGIDDDSFSGAGVIFKVYGENTLIYTSPTLTNLSDALNINVNIAGYTSIKLVVENSGGSVAANQADWGNARIIFDKPKNLTFPKIFPTCVELNWTSENDMNGIASYQVFKNDILQSNVPAGTLKYTFTGLSQSTSYKFSVKAIDTNGYESPKIDSTILTSDITVSYSANNQVCIGSPSIPSFSPLGGTFSINNKPDSVTFSLNANTGEILFGSDGFVQLKYTWGVGTTCEGNRTFYVGGLVKPNAPVISNVIDSLINKGTSVTYNASACASSYTLEWYNQSNNPSITVTPTDTSTYFAYCKNSTCYSNASNKIKLKVIPDCPNSFLLKSTVDDLSYGSKSFNFSASQTITASNKLTNPTGAAYKAGQKILLTPGFEIKPGSVFSATIGGCP